MNMYRTLSVLLLYPEQDWLECLPQLSSKISQYGQESGNAYAGLQTLLDGLKKGKLIDLQERYVATFDRNPSHSLHLFEHIHGESRDRGQAMVDLLQEYKRHGWDMVGEELPDYVPLFLEFLAQLPADEAAKLLGDAIDVLALIGRKLASKGSAYAAVFAQLEQMSPVAARELSEPPIRDMDEAMETFGPGGDGVEPLLKANPGVQTINFYPRATTRRACA